MAATPFKATVTIVDEDDNLVGNFAMSASDVANAFLTNDADSLSFIDLPDLDGEDLFITDIFLSAAGVDTTQLELWVNGVATPVRFRDAALASAANVARIPRPIPFADGSRIQLKQLA